MGPLKAISTLEEKPPSHQKFRKAGEKEGFEFPFEVRVAQWDVRFEVWKSASVLPTTKNSRYKPAPFLSGSFLYFLAHSGS